MRIAVLNLLVAMLPAQTWKWSRTEDLGCLTPPRALAGVGMSGTDLGVAFPRGDRIVFLFGDSWTLDRKDWDHDSIAWLANGPLTDDLPKLTWATQADGRFATLAPKARVQGAMDVPVEGLVLGDRTYVLFSSGWSPRTKRHSHSLLAHTDEGGAAALQIDHRVATERFVNISIVRDGDTLWMFGSGAYRSSAVYLARVAVDAFADRTAWRYWPDFSPDEAEAEPIVASDCVGELSVRRVPGGKLAMTYNATRPRGIHLRIADRPTGPWGDATVIFDPVRDPGYGVHMHQDERAVGYDDGLAMPGREREWGGEYGPYLVPEWCRAPTPGVLELVYTLSTWNPYTVRLVRSTVHADGTPWSPIPPDPPPFVAKTRTRNLTFANGSLRGWRTEGDAFATFRHEDGSWAVVTHVEPRGDAVEGRLWQQFTVSSTARELRGTVHGGTEAVELWCDGARVFATRGRRSNDIDVPFRWRLDQLRGQQVRLQIADRSAARWGFVTVRGLAVIE